MLSSNTDQLPHTHCTIFHNFVCLVILYRWVWRELRCSNSSGVHIRTIMTRTANDGNTNRQSKSSSLNAFAILGCKICVKMTPIFYLRHIKLSLNDYSCDRVLDSTNSSIFEDFCETHFALVFFLFLSTRYSSNRSSKSIFVSLWHSWRM